MKVSSFPANNVSTKVLKKILSTDIQDLSMKVSSFHVNKQCEFKATYYKGFPLYRSLKKILFDRSVKY